MASAHNLIKRDVTTKGKFKVNSSAHSWVMRVLKNGIISCSEVKGSKKIACQYLCVVGEEILGGKFVAFFSFIRK